MTEAPGRQARLRAEYASLYPGFEAGVWVDANELAEQLLTQHLLRPSPGFMLSSRLLPEDHFDSGAVSPLADRGLPGREAATQQLSSDCKAGPVYLSTSSRSRRVPRISPISSREIVARSCWSGL